MKQEGAGERSWAAPNRKAVLELDAPCGEIDRAAAARPERHLRGRPLRSHAVEHEPHRQEFGEPGRDGRHGGTIGPLLELANHARPAPEGQQRAADELPAVPLGDAVALNLAVDHLLRRESATGLERFRQLRAPGLGRPERAAAEAGHRREHSPFAVGHRPARHALIQERRGEPDQERMHELVGVDGRMHAADQVAMPHRWPHSDKRRPRPRHGLHAGVPEVAARAAFASRDAPRHAGVGDPTG